MEGGLESSYYDLFKQNYELDKQKLEIVQNYNLLKQQNKDDSVKLAELGESHKLNLDKIYKEID